MARFDFVIPERFLDSLGRMADVDRYAPQMIKAAAPILIRTTRAALKSVTSGEGTGDMVDSVDYGSIRHNQFGWWTSIYPLGYAKDRTGGGYRYRGKKTKGKVDNIRNMEKAAYLEYGRTGQTARPWVHKALMDGRKEALEAMREAFRKAVDSER